MRLGRQTTRRRLTITLLSLSKSIRSPIDWAHTEHSVCHETSRNGDATFEKQFAYTIGSTGMELHCNTNFRFEHTCCTYSEFALYLLSSPPPQKTTHSAALLYVEKTQDIFCWAWHRVFAAAAAATSNSTLMCVCVALNLWGLRTLCSSFWYRKRSYNHQIDVIMPSRVSLSALIALSIFRHNFFFIEWAVN